MPLPVKCILKQEDVEVFKQSQTFAKIMLYINACANASRGLPKSEVSSLHVQWTTSGAADPTGPIPVYAQWMGPVALMFTALRQAVADIPLQEMKDQRFGNKAFRDFHAWLDAHMTELISPVADALMVTKQGDDVCRTALIDELSGYLKDSFGNGSRLDFGTGHELHFFLFLAICLDEVQAMSLSTQEQQRLLAVTALCVFWDYIDFVRLVQRHYKLEPAGSHGVWGLDDYHHLSFIFGASQLVDAEKPSTTNPNPVLPKHITDLHHVEAHRDEYLYFGNIAWIRAHKKGPFHEHSSMLYNISGIDDWARITAGMIKMFDAEVLSKFNVVQHLLFGQHFPSPLAAADGASGGGVASPAAA